MSIFLNDEDDKKDVQDTVAQSIHKGKYMSLALGQTEKMMHICVDEYNKMYDAFKSEVLQWDHSDLANHCETDEISIQDWKNFLLDSRVQTWIEDEIYLMIRTKQVQLLDKVGEDRSTATVQALTALMKANEANANKIEDNKIYIYSFMPLSKEERRLNNVKILSSVPDEIRGALQHVSTDNNDE